MKVLRGFGNTIIGIILFALIFSLLFINRTSNLVEKDFLRETIKSTIDEVSNNDNSLTESQKKTIDDMFKDQEASSIISMVLENYKEYKNNSNYKVSEEDSKKLYDFVNKYRNYIKEISGENVSNMSEQEFEEYFNSNKIDEFAKNSFKEFDKEFNSKSLDKILDVYTIVTSNDVKLVILFTIIIFIGLLLLINWSLFKWMIVVGIDLIISGILFFSIYVSAELVKDMVLKEKARIQFNFDSFMISGIIQIVVGILLIVLYIVLKNVFKEKKNNSSNNKEEKVEQKQEEEKNEEEKKKDNIF